MFATYDEWRAKKVEALEEAVSAYWDCAYEEGRLRRPDGNKANAILAEIRAAAKALLGAEREACHTACRELAKRMKTPAERDAANSCAEVIYSMK